MDDNFHIAWAVEQWNSQVKERPIRNVHRRTLDDVWRQVIRHHGGDPKTLLSLPPHDDIVDRALTGKGR